jgi:hypothetical protein
MIAVGIAILIVGICLCVWAADAGQTRTERIRYVAAWRGRRRGEKAGRQIGGWR